MNNYSDKCTFLFPYIRFFNAMPHGGGVDFFIGNTLVASGIKFASFTPYFKTPACQIVCKVSTAGKKDEIFCKTSIRQSIGDIRCLCLTGTPGNCELTCFNEPCHRENMDYGHVRICNLSPENGSYDVFASGRKILGDIKFREMSRYMEIRHGNYEISFLKNEKKVLNCHSFEFPKSKFNTVYLCGFESENPLLSATLTTDAASKMGFYL